jgi:hypothetical protein
MEPKRKQIIALEEALNGVKDKREEAFLLVNAIPEVYLHDTVEYFRILLGFQDSPSRTC